MKLKIVCPLILSAAIGAMVLPSELRMNQSVCPSMRVVWALGGIFTIKPWQVKVTWRT